jgi:hypothetical protein
MTPYLGAWQVEEILSNSKEQQIGGWLKTQQEEVARPAFVAGI